MRQEFAEYTSAQERIALGKKSRKKEASQRRDAMKEMIADAYVYRPLYFDSCIHLYQVRKKMKKLWNGNKNNCAAEVIAPLKHLHHQLRPNKYTSLLQVIFSFPLFYDEAITEHLPLQFRLPRPFLHWVLLYHV